MEIRDKLSNIICESVQKGENVEIIVLTLLEEAHKLNKISLNNSNLVKLIKDIRKNQIKENPYIGLGGPTWKGKRVIF